MKKLILSLLASCCMVISLWSQNPKLNPLNYSGRMYVSLLETITTPRYESYEDHAILTTELSVPPIEVIKVEFDFKNNSITLDDKQLSIESLTIKEVEEDYSTTIVISMDIVDRSYKSELVWPEYGSPYLLEIHQNEDNVSIVKMNLSQKPVATSPEEAMLQMLNSFGGI